MPFCTECGNKLNPGAKFCSNCGTKVAAASPGAAAAAPRPKSKSPIRRPKSKSPTRNVTGAGNAIPAYRGAATQDIECKKTVKKAGWTPPTKEMKNVSGSKELTAHEQWAYYNNKLQCKGSGYGMAELKAFLPQSQCGFALFRLSAENVGNTGKGIITRANIILQWKGPSAKTMAKVKNNTSLNGALNNLKPNKGFIEVLGIKNLTTENVFNRWKPGSGSKVIQD